MSLRRCPLSSIPVGFQLMTVITLTAGTAFIMWLGEQITERGIGNGISLIIFAGIVCRLAGRHRQHLSPAVNR
jgi:preprotein translocase subunit SecY